MARTLIDVYGNTGFPGVEEPCVPGIAYSTGGQVSGWSQSALYATAVGSENVYSWFYPVKLPEHSLAFMAKPFFLVSRSLLVRGRASPMGVKVSKWSQSALLGIAVGLESAYSWFDLVCMARTLTFLHSETDVPCVQEPCGLW